MYHQESALGEQERCGTLTLPYAGEQSEIHKDRRSRVIKHRSGISREIHTISNFRLGQILSEDQGRSVLEDCGITGRSAICMSYAPLPENFSCLSVYISQHSSGWSFLTFYPYSVLSPIVPPLCIPIISTLHQREPIHTALHITLIDLASFATIMALVSLLAVAVVVAVSAIIHFVSSKEKARLPAGVQPLPGPKGMLSFKVHCF